MKKNSISIYKQENSFDEDEIKLENFIKPILRNKKYIFILSLLTSIVSIFYANNLKPIYRGFFDIVVADKASSTPSNKLSNILTQNNVFNQSGNTQELILKSPYVLNPVFEFIKKEYQTKGIDTKNMEFRSWLRSELDIEFQKDTEILRVSYLNNDKELIIKALNLISEKYQDYSNANIRREMNQAIEYLEEQFLINKQKLEFDLKKLNEFALENGLGATESTFVNIEQLNIREDDKQENSSSNSSNKENTNKRYEDLFLKLQQYEADYKEYSINLKPNTLFLKELEKKISGLKESLKKPTEILITHKQLVKEARSQEKFLDNIASQLNLMKFKKAKQLNPWEIISNPILDKQKVSPHKKIIVLKALFSSLIISMIFAYLFEKKKGILFETYNISKKLKCDPIESLNLNNLSSSINFIESYLNELKVNDFKNIGIYFLNSDKISNYAKFKNKLNSNDKFENLFDIDIFNYQKTQDFDAIILFIQSGKITIDDLIDVSKFIKLNEKKFVGWFFLESKN